MDDILIYGAVGDWWEGLDASTLVPRIAQGSGDLTIAINSPGGNIVDGIAIFNAIARAVEGGRTVTCRIDGLAASMASVIALAGSAVVMADNALMMIHNPWDCACGDASELRKAAETLDKMKETIVGIYARRTGKDEGELATLMDEETWLSASEALDMGFIDTIGTSASTSGSAAARTRVSACNITKFGFRNTPNHPLIAGSAMAMIGSTPAATSVKPKGKSMTEEEKAAAAAAAADAKARADAEAKARADAAQAAIAAERARATAIRQLGDKHKLPASTISGMIDEGITVEVARERVLDHLAARDEALGGSTPGGAITITHDARDKWLMGASNWLIVRAGMANTLKKASAARGEKIDLDPGEFVGVNLLDLAREALHRSGASNVSRDPAMIVGGAFTARNNITQGAGDFPVLLENVMHKVLQAAYQITPDTWSRFCGTGTVTDFRPQNRYLRGTFSSLDALGDLNEFQQKSIPDGEKQTISASTKGNIISLSRQAVINDDMGAFITLASDLGRAAKLTIEKDVYALLASNPVMYDGSALFSNTHRNIAGGSWTLPGGGSAPSAAAIGVLGFDAARVAMASQLDPSGNEILDIRPEVLLVPLVDEGLARVIIGSKFDTDVSGKYEVPNKVQGLVADIVGSARINPGTSGHGWYFFADKEMAPAIEVVFLNGVDEPFLDNSLGWRVDGTEFKVRLDYGVGAVNWRSAFYNPGL